MTHAIGRERLCTCAADFRPRMPWEDQPMAAGLVDDSTPADSVGSLADAPSRFAPLRRYLAIEVLTAGCLAFYLFHAFADQAAYLTTGYDLGIFDQAVRAYSHFQAPMI